MAKNVFFSEETMNGMDKICEAGMGEAAVKYGKGNFLLGAATTAYYGMVAYVAYQAYGITKSLVKYLKS